MHRDIDEIGGGEEKMDDRNWFRGETVKVKDLTKKKTDIKDTKEER